MALKDCAKCGEMVDEAKAFCPGCGHAFAAEAKRDEASGFDKMEGTVRLGQTIYNQMLSDMGLQTPKLSGPGEKQSVAIGPKPAATKPLDQNVDKPKSNKKTKWFIVGGIIVLLFLLAIAATVSGYIYWPWFLQGAAVK